MIQNKLSKLIIFAFLIQLGTTIPVHASPPIDSTLWNLNDVSILYALPQSVSENTDSLLSPYSAGKKGALIRKDFYAKIPPINDDGVEVLYNQEIKLISVRIDPCPNTFDTSKCQPEVRLVWQPVVLDTESAVQKWVTLDAAIHTFYKLTPSEFLNFKNELLSLKKENLKYGVDTNHLPLQIHPAFLSKKTKKFFTEKFNALILKNCGQTNIQKMTFMSLLTQNIWWRFGGVERQGNQWNQVKIPRVNLTFEDIFNSAHEENPPLVNKGTEMDSVFNIIPDNYPEEDNLLSVINDGYRFNDEKDLAVFKTKIDAIERFRNPHFTNSATLDCSSCHYADNTRFYMNQRFNELTRFDSKYSFKNPNPQIFNLSNSSVVQKATRVIRAFGYFENQPAISQRAIHDSSESAHWLNSNGR